jgi:hypothetical protein
LLPFAWRLRSTSAGESPRGMTADFDMGCEIAKPFLLSSGRQAGDRIMQLAWRPTTLGK